MRYVIARLADEDREMAYRFYVTSSLQLIPQSKCKTQSFYDMLYPKEEEEKTAEEIVNDVAQKAGLTILR